jgi:molybdopterin converting factor small subunit
VLVNVKLYATLKRFAPKHTELGESFPVDIQDGYVEEVLTKLGISEDKAKIIMVNGVQTQDLMFGLKESDLVVIFPPIGGG